MTTDTPLFKARTRGSITPVFKSDGEFIVWGPASVEVVDKEDDIIRADALEEALPQLLKRKRVSLDHSDQLVGDILEQHVTDEPVELEINGESVARKEFPTAVMTPEEDGVPEKGLYVCSKIYDDSRVARETREKIEQGEYDSYSISGDSISSTTKVEDGSLIDDINEIDLSAVTICEDGMNQRAEFGVVSKLDASASEGHRDAVAKSESVTTMTDDDNGGGLTPDQLRKEVRDAAGEVLPDGELATKEYIDSRIEETLAEKGVIEKECEHGSPEDECPICNDDTEKAIDDPEVQDAIDTLAEGVEGLDASEARDMVEQASEMAEAEAEDEPPDEKEGETYGAAEEDDPEPPEEMPEESADDPPVEDPPVEDPPVEDDDEMPPEMADEEEAEVDDGDEKISAEQMKSELPDDLYDAVKAQLGLDGAANDSPTEKADTESADGDEAAPGIGDIDVDGDDPIEKSVNQSLAEMAAGADVTDDPDTPFADEYDDSSGDVSKSGAEGEVSADVGTLDAFYAEADN